MRKAIKDDEIYGPIRAEICDAYIAAGKPKPERNRSILEESHVPEPINWSFRGWWVYWEKWRGLFEVKKRWWVYWEKWRGLFEVKKRRTA
jgi:hypothetical protein